MQQDRPSPAASAPVVIYDAHREARVPSAEPAPEEHYVPRYAGAIQDLCAKHPLAGDLATSFPALLFALANGYGTEQQRAHVLARLDAGARLKEMARDLGLPWWLRRLRGNAFVRPIPRLPLEGDDFRRRIASLVPAGDTSGQLFLKQLGHAFAIGDAEWVLWNARHPIDTERLRKYGLRQLLHAWHWACHHPDTVLGSFVTARWCATMSIDRAAEEAQAWERRLELHLLLGDGRADIWVPEKNVCGYQFVALRTGEDFAAEAKAMTNCLDHFAERICANASRVFSIRKDGVPVANVEITPHEDDPQRPALNQLRGPKNERAGAAVWQAAHRWLGEQALPGFPGPGHSTREEIRACRDAVWQPLLADISDAPDFAKAMRLMVTRIYGSVGTLRAPERVRYGLALR